MSKSILKTIPMLFLVSNVFSQQITKSLDTVISRDYPSPVNVKTIRFTNTLNPIYLRMFEVDSSYRPFVDSIYAPVNIMGSSSIPGCPGIGIMFSIIQWNSQNCLNIMGTGTYFDLGNFNVYTAMPSPGPLPKASDISDEDTVVIPIKAYFTNTAAEPVRGNPLIVRFYIKAIYNVYPGDITPPFRSPSRSVGEFYGVNGRMISASMTNKRGCLTVENRRSASPTGK